MLGDQGMSYTCERREMRAWFLVENLKARDSLKDVYMGK
jgi:hypothetical protein